MTLPTVTYDLRLREAVRLAHHTPHQEADDTQAERSGGTTVSLRLGPRQCRVQTASHDERLGKDKPVGVRGGQVITLVRKEYTELTTLTQG